MDENLEFYNWDRGNIYNVSPILICKIEGISSRLLVDTGASISVLDTRFLDANPILKDNIEEVMDKVTLNMQGGSTEMNHTISTTLCTNGFRGDHDFYIMPITMGSSHQEDLRYDGIVGCDFLIKSGAIINLQEFTLTFGT